MNMRSSLKRLLILAVALTLLSAACGDDDELGTDASTTTIGSTTTEGATTTAPPTSEDTSAPTTAPAGDPGDGGDGDLDALLERYRQTPLRLVYQTGMTGTDETMVVAQDPTQNPPVSSFGFPEQGTRLIQGGDEIVICSEGMCFSMPAEGSADLVTGMFGGAFLAGLLTADVTDLPGLSIDSDDVTIAGRDGVCFTYTATAIVGSTTEFARQCVDEELGFTLLLEVKESDAEEAERALELIEFGDPTPEDFEPTGPITEMPTG
jgi:hypothetical protein